MPTFHITAPDGTSYEVTGPAGATEKDALAQVQAQHAPDNGGILKNLGAGLEGALTELPSMAMRALPGLGAAETAGQALTTLITKKPSPKPSDLISGHAINTALGKLSPSLNPENVTANTFPERVARGAGAGLTGALIPGAGEMTVGRMLANAAIGSVSGAGAATGAELAPDGYKPLGAVAGAIAAPVGAVGLTNALRAGAGAAKSAASAFTASGPEQTVGKILSEAAGGTVPKAAEAPLPGMKPTVGQATGNPGLLYLERSVEQSAPGAAAKAAESRTASNQAITDAISQIGNADGAPSEAMLNRLESAQKAAKAETAAKWKAAGVDESTPLPKDALQKQVSDYLGTLTTASRGNIPGSLLKTLEEIPADGATLGEIQDWRANIGDEARAAFRAGQGNKGRIIGGLQTVVGDFLDEAPSLPAPITTRNGIQSPTPGAPTAESIAAYKAARTATAQMKQRFGANSPGSPVATALAPKEFGTAAESNTANLFLKPRTSAGAPEAFDAYLKGLGNDQQGLQAARDAFAQKFQDAISGVPDATGTPTIKAAGVSKFLDNYDHVINSKLFTPDQRDMLKRIDEAANMSARTSRAGAPGGSDTFAKFSGKNWVDALVGAGTKKAARVIGASVGYATGGPMGAAAGAYGAPKIMETMLSANKEASMRLLTQAIYDPALAKTLMTAATKSQAQKIPLTMQARIFSILLGKSSNDNAARKAAP